MQKKTECSDCHSSPLNRRDFVKAGSAAAVVTAAAASAHAAADKPKKSPAETQVAELYESLSDKQKETICFEFKNPLRSKVNANWHITKPELDDDFYTDAQRELVKRIVKGVTSEDGYKRLEKQMEEDSGGLGAYSIAIFGKPGSDAYQWVLTGRHLTLRADGDTTVNSAFGGPIVYGHSEEEPKHNLFHYQTKKANEVFAALDKDQREAALLNKAPRENQVPLQGKSGRFPGVAVGKLSDDQKELVEATIKVVLAPYREQDVQEVVKTLKKTGGLDALHMAFYRQGDLEKDEVWDIWRMEGPGFVWHFRGAPHVHTYVNIGIV